MLEDFKETLFIAVSKVQSSLLPPPPHTHILAFVKLMRLTIDAMSEVN